MTLEVHKATMADANELLVTINEALRFKLSHGDTTWEEKAFTADDIKAAIARGTLYTVKVDGSPAGSVVLLWDDEYNWGRKGLDSKAGYIHQLATRNAFRGRNLGGQIIVWVANEIKKTGRSAIRLDCPAANTKLCGYYEKRGFQQVGVSNAGKAFYERPV